MFQPKTKNISPSLLKSYLIDPFYMYQKHLTGEIKWKSTTSLLIGSAIDCYLTEGFEKFVKLYRPVARRDLKNPPTGYTEMTQSDFDKAKFIAGAVAGTKAYKYIIDNKFIAQHHIVVPYKCGIFENLSGIPDWYKINENGICDIIDLKSTKAILSDKFIYEVKEYNYRMSQYYYGKLLKMIFPEIKGFRYLILAVENTEPNRVRMYELNPSEMFGVSMEVDRILDEISRLKVEDYKPANVDMNNIEVI